MIPAGVVAALLLVPMLPFWPGRDEPVEDLVHGPGAAGFADGLRWTGATLILAPALVAALELFDGAVRPPRNRSTAPTGARPGCRCGGRGAARSAWVH